MCSVPRFLEAWTIVVTVSKSTDFLNFSFIEFYYVHTRALRMTAANKEIYQKNLNSGKVFED